MLITILTIIALCINSRIIFLTFGDNNFIFRSPLLAILVFGIIQPLSMHLCAIFFPQWLHLLLAFPIGLLFGPSLLLLARNLIGGAIYKGLSIHLVPFVIMFILFFVLVINSSFRYRFVLDYTLFLSICSVVHVLAYLVWLFALLTSMYSFQMKIENKVWLALLIVLFFIISLMIINLSKHPEDLDIHRGVALTLYILLLFNILPLWSVSRNPNLLENPIEEKKIGSQEKISYSLDKECILSGHSLSVEFVTDYRNKIENFIRTQAFLDSKLNREQMCRSLKIPSNHLSIFLNEEFGKNFNGFINQLRLIHAANQLKSQDLSYNMEELSFVCGFRSRASFYRNFLEEFGCSPLQYRLDNCEVP